MQVDDTDRKIISLLEEDGRRPVTEIADLIGLSSAGVHKRLTKLEEADIIKGYDAIVDPDAVGLDAHAVIRLRFEQGHVEEAKEQLRQLEEVQSIRLLAGRWDATIRVYAPEVTTLRELFFNEIKELQGIAHSEMDLVLDTEYRKHGLPIETDTGEPFHRAIQSD